MGGKYAGNLRRRVILDPRRLPLSLFSQSLLLLLRFTVSFPTDEWFSPEGRWFSRNILADKTWWYLLKYGCGVYCFVVIFFLLIGVHLHVETWPGFCTSTLARTTLQHRLSSILLSGNTYRAWKFCVNFVFLGRFCRKLSLWNIFGAELLSHDGVQSDQLPPVELSGSTFSIPFSNRSFLADPLSASQNKEFVLSLLIFRVSSSRRRARESGVSSSRRRPHESRS